MHTEEDFWAKVAIYTDHGACWPWTGAVDTGGYGRLRWHGEQRLAHHVALEISTGRRPENPVWYAEECKGPPCVRPDHLVEAERKEIAVTLRTHLRLKAHMPPDQLAATEALERAKVLRDYYAARVETLERWLVTLEK